VSSDTGAFGYTPADPAREVGSWPVDQSARGLLIGDKRVDIAASSASGREPTSTARNEYDLGD
jgi:hypothetical protein